jgi:hypothetical protein
MIMNTKTNQLIIRIWGNFSNSVLIEFEKILKISLFYNKIENTKASWNGCLFREEFITLEKLEAIIDSVYNNWPQLKQLGVKDVNFSLGIYQPLPKKWVFSKQIIQKMAKCNSSISVDFFNKGFKSENSEQFDEDDFSPRDIIVECFLLGTDMNLISIEKTLSTNLITNAASFEAAFVVKEYSEFMAMEILLLKLYHYIPNLESSGVKSIKIRVLYKFNCSSEISIKQIKQMAKLNTFLELE